MHSGVPSFSLPELLVFTPDNITRIKPIHQLEKGVDITNVTFSPNGKYLAVARMDKTLHIWSTLDYQLIYTFNIEPICIECVTFSPDSRFIASVKNEHPDIVLIWDMDTGKSPWESPESNGLGNERISSLIFSPDGKYLAEAIGNHVFLWEVDIKGFQFIRVIGEHTTIVDSLAFSPDSGRLLTTSKGDGVNIWDVATGNFVMTLKGYSYPITNGKYTHDNTWIVTTGEDNIIRFWNNHTGGLEKTFHVPNAQMEYMVFNPDGQLFVSGNLDDRIILWEVESTGVLSVITENDKINYPLDFSPDNKILVTTYPDDTLWLWGVVK